MRTKLFLIVTLITGVLYMNAQDTLPKYGYGPGGIGAFTEDEDHAAYMALWLRADKGVEMDINNPEKVATWRNQTGDFNHATDQQAGTKPNVTFTIKQPPTYIENGIGRMPSINFGDPGGDAYALTIMNEPYFLGHPRLDSTQNLSIFIVFRRKEIPNEDFRAIMQKRNEGNPDENGRAWILEFDGGADANQAQFFLNRNLVPLSIKSETVFDQINKNHVLGVVKGSYEVSGTTYNVARMYNSGVRERDEYYDTAVVKCEAPTVIGQADKADIAEIVVYRSFLDQAKSVILSNHLAAKYRADILDTYGQGVPAYERKGNCRFDVIGVGRGSGNEFIHSASKGGGIILEATEFTGNHRYVFAGHPDSTDVPVSVDSNDVWSRYYFVQNFGVRGTNIYFHFDSVGLSDPGEVGDYKLYFSAESGEETDWIEATYDTAAYVDGTIRYSFTNIETGFYVIGKSAPEYEVEVGIGMIKEEQEVDLLVYPNPVADVLNIETKSEITDRFVMNIYNYAGVLTMSQQFTGTTQIDVSSLSKGLYILELLGDNGERITQKMIKQ